ncbi:hypothetical protein ACHAWF_009644 [Thalassiosira exigua]
MNARGSAERFVSNSKSFAERFGELKEYREMSDDRAWDDHTFSTRPEFTTGKWETSKQRYQRSYCQCGARVRTYCPCNPSKSLCVVCFALHLTDITGVKPEEAVEKSPVSNDDGAISSFPCGRVVVPSVPARKLADAGAVSDDEKNDDNGVAVELLEEEADLIGKGS